MYALMRDRRGSVAVWFSLSLLPMLAIVGVVIDYNRTAMVRDQMLSIGDQAALSAAVMDDPSSAQAMIEKMIRSQLTSDVSGISIVKIDNGWVDSSNYKVEITAKLDMQLLSAMPGLPDDVEIKVSAVANRVPPVYKVLPPSMSLLEPEAADYNRAYIYCFNPSRTSDADKGRRDFVPIADNATPPTDFSTKVENWKLPECQAGEVVSYMMRNVRNSRTNQSKWDATSDYYEYFTDTRVDPNSLVLTNNLVGEYIDKNKKRSAVDLVNKPMLETIVCKDADECRPKSKGGILPDRKTDRDPAVAKEACTPGKFMYYGYEDRPGGDRDYDDIRLVVSCPETIKVQDKQIRIAM